MANGVNVKMGVSGVAQFKQSINQAKTSIKTLDAQLKLTEKQYQATGDAEAYMQQKAEQLQSKMEAQKSIIQTTEKALEDMRKRGVDMNSKAFQDMVQQLAKANADLLDTQMQIQGVETASDGASAAVSDMASELNNIGTQVSFKTVIGGLDSIADGLQKAVKKAYELGKALYLSTLDSAAWADEINTAAKQAQMSTKQYQQMAAAAEQVDTSLDSVLSSQQKLATAAEKDNKDMAAIFARLGVQTTRYGEVRDLNDLFWETGEALMQIENAADQADMGKKIFGSQWRELIPMFQMGRKEYEKLVESQTYVDDEHLQSLQELDDSYKDMQHQIEVLKNDFFAELAPSIKVVTDALSDLMKRFNEYLKSEKGQEMMKSLGENIEKLFSSIVNFDPEQAVKTIGDVMGAIQQGFEWIANNWDAVSTGLQAIAVGWAAIKTATVGLKIAELVTGLKGLGFGKTPTGGSPDGTPVTTGDATKTTLLQGIGYKLAPTLAKAGNAAVMYGGMLGAVGDRFINETNMGRAIRDGTDVLEGLKQDVQETTDSIKHNAETFSSDWDDVFKYNPLFSWMRGTRPTGESYDTLMGMQSKGTIEKAQLFSFLSGQSTKYGNFATDELLRFWRGEGDWDQARIDALMESVNDAYDRMEKASEDVSGSTETSTKASTDMSAAAEDMMSLPALVENAVINGMSQVKIYIDGQQAGTAVAPFVDGALGGILALTRT
jgi:hypothetical protein